MARRGPRPPGQARTRPGPKPGPLVIDSKEAAARYLVGRDHSTKLTQAAFRVRGEILPVFTDGGRGLQQASKIAAALGGVVGLLAEVKLVPILSPNAADRLPAFLAEARTFAKFFSDLATYADKEVSAPRSGTFDRTERRMFAESLCGWARVQGVTLNHRDLAALAILVELETPPPASTTSQTLDAWRKVFNAARKVVKARSELPESPVDAQGVVSSDSETKVGDKFAHEQQRQKQRTD